MALKSSIQDVLHAKYDYIVVGGGPSGCVMASRLTEDPNTSVLLLEAGPCHDEDDHLIVTPALAFGQFHNPKYDWAFKTVPQSAANNRVIVWNRGRGLGGSTNLNLLHWTYPSREDIDAWERLGNTDWNFNELEPYLKKTHTFHSQTISNLTPGGTPVDSRLLGTEGPVPVCYPVSSPAGQAAILETFKNVVPGNNEPFDGDTLGVCTALFATNTSGKRVNAYTSYLKPHLSRPNLSILTNATVVKLIIDDVKKGGLISSKGVEVIYEGETYEIPVQKEVILAAGALKSPQILELSGIGDKNILSRFGIDVVLELPGVGKNLQEHTISGAVTFELMKEESMKYNKTNEEYAAYFFPPAVVNLPIQSLPKEACQEIEEYANSRKTANIYSEAFKEQLAILAERLSAPESPNCEVVIWSRVISPKLVPRQDTQYITLGYFGCSPWSRGQIHISSKDPMEPPTLAANHVREDIDLKILIEFCKYLRTFKDIAPFSSVVEKEVLPGPDIQTDDEIENYILNSVLPGWHASGSLSMLPREKEGVVDRFLKVWGTTNIRVVDISIQPIIMSGHTQALVYAVAEYAADMIRNGL